MKYTKNMTYWIVIKDNGQMIGTLLLIEQQNEIGHKVQINIIIQKSYYPQITAFKTIFVGKKGFILYIYCIEQLHEI